MTSSPNDAKHRFRGQSDQRSETTEGTAVPSERVLIMYIHCVTFCEDDMSPFFLRFLNTVSVTGTDVTSRMKELSRAQIEAKFSSGNYFTDVVVS